MVVRRHPAGGVFEPCNGPEPCPLENQAVKHLPLLGKGFSEEGFCVSESGSEVSGLGMSASGRWEDGFRRWTTFSERWNGHSRW